MEETTQRLIGAGCNLQTDHNPYSFFIYASFQAGSTWVIDEWRGWPQFHRSTQLGSCGLMTRVLRPAAHTRHPAHAGLLTGVRGRPRTPVRKTTPYTHLWTHSHTHGFTPHAPPCAPQERGTKISHANTAKLAVQHGDRGLWNVCTVIANDEARHESEEGARGTGRGGGGG
jgi:hypothetical protein